MTNDLKKHLENNPQLSHVYLNDKDEWQFHNRAGYDKVLTRDEVLAMDVPKKIKAPEPEKEPADKPLTAKQKKELAEKEPADKVTGASNKENV